MYQVKKPHYFVVTVEKKIIFTSRRRKNALNVG